MALLDAGPSAFVTATHRDLKYRIEPVVEMVCRRSVELPDLHGDPADRITLATAGQPGCIRVSKDSGPREYTVVLARSP